MNNYVIFPDLTQALSLGCFSYLRGGEGLQEPGLVKPHEYRVSGNILKLHPLLRGSSMVGPLQPHGLMVACPGS